tara:strand:- start:1244 stop:2869 length:1626 start_codon:yes stop_codon:yes gene_type:complete
MAKKVIQAELDLATGQALKSVEGLNKKLKATNKEITQTQQKGNKFTNTLGKGFRGVGKAVTGFGNALKKAGIGLAVAAFAKLADVLTRNQTAIDFFTTANNALNIAFNDFINLVIGQGQNIVNFFKAIFEDPVGSLKDFGQSIKDNITERFNSLLDTLGFLASAVKKVFSGDFTGALEDVKQAGKESVDILTGVDNSVDKVANTTSKIIKATKGYTSEIIKQAKAQTEVNKSARVAEAQNALLLQQFDLQAEKQRQLRDDTSASIEDRIAANKRLGEVLDEQEKLMLANAQATLDAAKANKELNDNEENRIALINAEMEMADVRATVAGFRSEQLTNENSLIQEGIDLEKTKAEETIANEEAIRNARNQTFDLFTELVGAETAIGKALFLAKQSLILKEQIANAKAAIAKVSMSSTEAAADGVKGIGKAFASAPPPLNAIPAAIAVAQAAMTAKSMIQAVAKAKQSASQMGATGGSTPSVSAPTIASTPPAFNVVGQAPENQLAETIAGQQQQPVKAFVVSDEVSTAQALDRNIIESASIG